MQRNKNFGCLFCVRFDSKLSMEQGSKINGRINNVFDRKFETAYGYNQVRRGVFAGLNWQMK